MEKGHDSRSSEKTMSHAKKGKGKHSGGRRASPVDFKKIEEKYYSEGPEASIAYRNKKETEETKQASVSVILDKTDQYYSDDSPSSSEMARRKIAIRKYYLEDYKPPTSDRNKKKYSSTNTLAPISTGFQEDTGITKESLMKNVFLEGSSKVTFTSFDEDSRERQYFYPGNPDSPDFDKEKRRYKREKQMEMEREKNRSKPLARLEMRNRRVEECSDTYDYSSDDYDSDDSSNFTANDSTMQYLRKFFKRYEVIFETFKVLAQILFFGFVFLMAIVNTASLDKLQEVRRMKRDGELDENYFYSA